MLTEPLRAGVPPSDAEVSLQSVPENSEDPPAKQPSLATRLWNCDLPVLGGTWRNLSERLGLFVELVKWAVLVLPMSMIIGAACSSLLWALTKVTELRDGICETEQTEEYTLADCPVVVNSNRWLLFLLPFAGVLSAVMYDRLGDAKSKGGANTLWKEMRAIEAGRDGSVPLRMAPLVWVGTVLTHLFGGSAGREGTAIQMAVSIASKYASALSWVYSKCTGGCGISSEDTHTLLVTAVGCGFAGIFGVPFAGATFGVEVLKVGTMRYEAFVPALIGSFAADYTCRALNEHLFHFDGHTEYECVACVHEEPQSYGSMGQIDISTALAIVPASFAFGYTSYLFSACFHEFKHAYGRTNAWLATRLGLARPQPLFVPFLGGVVVILFWLLLSVSDHLILEGGRGDWRLNLPSSYDGRPEASISYTYGQPYLGLGVATPGLSISTAFEPEGVEPLSFLWKLLAVTLTLAAGFKGGEVTPLFFIGAALGNSMARVLAQDVQLFAALGFVSVFSGATNTPFACTIMGLELFGGAQPFYFAEACFLSYIFSGISGIYEAQVVSGASKLAGARRRRLQTWTAIGDVDTAEDVTFLKAVHAGIVLHSPHVESPTATTPAAVSEARASRARSSSSSTSLSASLSTILPLRRSTSTLPVALSPSEITEHAAAPLRRSATLGLSMSLHADAPLPDAPLPPASPPIPGAPLSAPLSAPLPPPPPVPAAYCTPPMTAPPTRPLTSITESPTVGLPQPVRSMGPD